MTLMTVAQAFAAERIEGNRDTLPAPTGGWNARDPIAKMPPRDAIFLDNFYPTTSDVSQRKGSLTFATLPADDYPTDPHDIRSLLSYSSPTGSKQFFAGCQDGIYDITAGGAIAAPDSVCTNGEWLYTNITTAGGSFIWCCNSVDDSRYYDGTNWLVLTAVSVPALTGITSSLVAHVNLYKFRLFFCEEGTLSFWYLPVNSVAGAAVAFPLGALFKRGGYLMATGTWTLDGGNGPDDYFVAITSEGEVAVYSGANPADATDWFLVGVYFIGAPVGRDCLVKIGGDLGIITVQGLYPLSKALILTATDRSSAISDKIAKAWTDYTSRYKGLFGWQATYFANESMLLVNVPILADHAYQAGVISYQFVINMQTKAWCRFFGWSSEAWEMHDGKLYFAKNNVVYQAWIGTADDLGAIESRGKQAFFYPGGKGMNSQISLLRPLTTGAAGVPYQFGIDTDYAEGFLPLASSGTVGPEVGMWAVSSWDEAVWASYNLTQKAWRTAFHYPGTAISFRLRINRKDANMAWIGTDYLLKTGFGL